MVVCILVTREHREHGGSVRVLHSQGEAEEPSRRAGAILEGFLRTTSVLGPHHKGQCQVGSCANQTLCSVIRARRMWRAGTRSLHLVSVPIHSALAQRVNQLATLSSEPTASSVLIAILQWMLFRLVCVGTCRFGGCGEYCGKISRKKASQLVSLHVLCKSLSASRRVVVAM